VDVYAFEVRSENEAYPEAGQRRRQWVSADEARALLEEPGLRAVFDRLEEHLGA